MTIHQRPFTSLFVFGVWSERWSVASAGGNPSVCASIAISSGSGAMPRPCVAIYWVANQRMAKMREVHANLMRASGFQIALHGADGWARFVRHCEHPVMGARGLACRAGNNGMLNTVARMASKRGIDGAFLPRKRPKRK